MNRVPRKTDYDRQGTSRRRVARRGQRRAGAHSALALFVALTAAVVVGLLIPLNASSNPHHFAGDYVLFAKAIAAGITTGPKAFEPDCDETSTGQRRIGRDKRFQQHFLRTSPQ